jgi:alpha-N-acetylglucosaminidase
MNFLKCTISTRLSLYLNEKPFIWSKLHNFGDTSGLRGDIDHINSAFPYQAFEAQSSIIGIGATPEGIDQNPLYYDFLYEQNFRPEPVKNLTTYLIQLNHKRYGLQETDQNVLLAWTYLLKSSYSQDFSVQDLTAVAHLHPRPSSSLFESDRSTPKPLLCNIFQAWIHLVEAADSMREWTDPFLYDLVNVGREVLAQLSTPIALNFSDALSVESMNSEELVRTGGVYVELLLDLDRLLGTNRAFLLSPWLELARRLAQEDAAGSSQNDCFSPILRNQTDTGCCSCFYEFNARVQITTWNPTPYGANRVPDGPVDYAAKHWSGLIEGYYAKRARILLKQALQDQQNDQPLNSTEVERIFAVHAYEWTTSVNNKNTSFATSSSLLRDQRTTFRETIRTSKEMLEKYSHWFKACQ